MYLLKAKKQPEGIYPYLTEECLDQTINQVDSFTD